MQIKRMLVVAMVILTTSAAKALTLRPDSVADSLMLKAVVVKGTRIRMVSRGDTIIYDAQAFAQSEGSMLKELVKQLPGVEVGKDGVVRVNGRAIDYLTLNGKDFFKGKNNIMLDNLPAYTVKKINVYHKSTAKSRYMGRDMEDKDYVMDVELKRDFLQGYSANAEAAYGTEQRYLARLFALGYTTTSRLAIYGNANNINVSGASADNDDWQPSVSATSPIDTKTVGMNFSTGNEDESIKNVTDGELSWTDNQQNGWTSGERFLASGNVFSNSAYSSPNKGFSLNVNNYFEMSKPLFLTVSASVNYSGNKGETLLRTANFNTDPSAAGTTTQIIDSVFTSPGHWLNGILTNRTSDDMRSETYNLWANGNIYLSKRLTNGDGLNLSVSGSYGKITNKTYDLYRLDYTDKAQSDDYRNRYNDAPSKSYMYSFRGGYDMTRLKNWTFALYATYNQSHNRSTNDRYRLERLAGWSVEDGRRLGDLPSTRDSMLMALDATNSYSSIILTRTYEGQASAVYMKTDKEGFTRFAFILPVKRLEEQLRYVQNATDTTLNRHYVTWLPIVQMNKYGSRGGYGFGYRGNVSAPALSNNVNTRDDSNPLAVKENNPGLKKAVTHYLSAEKDFKKASNQSSLSLSATATLTQHALANGRSYNRLTGVYTYRPENVEGNWGASGYVNYSCSPDSLRRWTLNTTTNFSFNHNVDMAADNDGSGNTLSKVDNYNTTEQLSLRYQNGETMLQADGQLTWRNSSSRNEGFTPINAFDFSYGLTAQVKLPWNFKLNSDLKVYSRRGYADRVMNTDDVLWNLAVFKLFANNRLSLKLACMDLLRQQKNVSYFVDGQGKTESWTNSIPHYVMLSLSYKFNISPES